MQGGAAVVVAMVHAQARRGFSIMELTVVLVIVSILSTLGILSYANLHESNEAKSGGQRVAATLASARQYAIAANAPHQVYFSIPDSAFWIDELDAAGAVRRRQVENPGFLPQFIVFDRFVVNGVAQDADTVAVRFWPDGHSDTATIDLRRSVDDPSNTRNSASVRLFGPTAVTQVTMGQ